VDLLLVLRPPHFPLPPLQAHIKRLQRELRDISNEPMPGIALEPLETDIWFVGAKKNDASARKKRRALVRLPRA